MGTEPLPRNLAEDIKLRIELLQRDLEKLPPSRDISMAKTKLDEAQMWVERIYP